MSKLLARDGKLLTDGNNLVANTSGCITRCCAEPDPGDCDNSDFTSAPDCAGTTYTLNFSDLDLTCSASCDSSISCALISGCVPDPGHCSSGDLWVCASDGSGDTTDLGYCDEIAGYHIWRIRAAIVCDESLCAAGDGCDGDTVTAEWRQVIADSVTTPPASGWVLFASTGFDTDPAVTFS